MATQRDLQSPPRTQMRTRRQLDLSSEASSHHALQPDPAPSAAPPQSPRSTCASQITRVMCCPNIILRPPKTAIINPPPTETPPDHPILTWFASYCAGKWPARIASSPIPWSSYTSIFGIAHFESRKAKACTAITIYAISHTDGAELIQIPEEEFLEVVGNAMAASMKDECLVRKGGGLEWACKRHLDTVYTLYFCVYQERAPVMPVKVLMAPPRGPPVVTQVSPSQKVSTPAASSSFQTRATTSNQEAPATNSDPKTPATTQKSPISTPT
ncbi:hypothetical protein GLAREA_06356 [Glarea lozoyensis ATCC 20868]|uniref:Uncharacterized protein n=1 Tax=Glarea lozoyensis (strain ATCC 20868 / MF5171) TaxID=1116229 RepID=S3D8A2_GLAL2|nr:uncharacterized protein GLAREA_06356 [Glarea lozoyensis ATCC 20868]EPE33344.1 hypothetical protein GLAREA_06356 [Glarea lozoyensis ATCC 20868]